MFTTSEKIIPLTFEKTDISTFKENPYLGNNIPLILQLKGFNRRERIKRRNDQQVKGESGSPTERKIAEGALYVVDNLQARDFLSAKNTIFELALPDPRGMAVSDTDLFIGSVNQILHLQENGSISVIKYPWFAFIHSLQLSNDGQTILITSPGFDRIIEMKTNTAIPVWEWSAWDHGYDKTHSSGKKIVSEFISPKDFPSGLGLPPGDRTAFPNSAAYLNNKTILASLFYDGVIKIDKETGRATPVLENLTHPHGIRKYKDGFIVTNSAGGVCLVMDDQLHVIQELSFNNLPYKSKEAGSTEWLQNVVPLNSNLLAAIDSNRASIFIVDLDNKSMRRIPYDPNWVIQEVAPISSKTQFFQNANSFHNS